MLKNKKQVSVGLISIVLLTLGGVVQVQAESLEDLKARMAEHVKKIERSSRSLSRCSRNKKNGKRTRSNVFEAGRSRNEGK